MVVCMVCIYIRCELEVGDKSTGGHSSICQYLENLLKKRNLLMEFTFVVVPCDRKGNLLIELIYSCCGSLIYRNIHVIC